MTGGSKRVKKTKTKEDHVRTGRSPSKLQQLAARVALTCSTYQSAWCLATLSAAPSYFRPPRFPLLYPSCCPPCQADARRWLLSCASSSCHLTMNRSASARTPRYHFPTYFAAVTTARSQSPDTRGGCSVGPSVARSSLRSSTMHLWQVLNCPPGFGFSPPGIVPNITRMNNRSLLCRATAPARKSRPLRMVVSMLSQRAMVRAFANERVVRSVRSRRWKPIPGISRKNLVVSRSKLWRSAPL